MHVREFTLSDVEATLQLGAALAESLLTLLPLASNESSFDGSDLNNNSVSSLLLALQGDLGSGKTTIVRGLLRQLQFIGKVKSPSFSLLETYSLPEIMVHHLDFYRFSHAEEFLDAGFDELFRQSNAASALCLVEWPELAAAYLPPADLSVHLDIRGEFQSEVANAVTAEVASTSRFVRLQANSARGKTWLQNLNFQTSAKEGVSCLNGLPLV